MSDLNRRHAIKKTFALGLGAGALASIAPRSSSKNFDRQAKALSKNQLTSFDVLIVGAGNAGMPAAIQAADLGARVLLIDKNPFVGGMLNISGGHISAANSKLQISKGISDSPDAHYRDAMRMGRYLNNSELLKIATDNAASMVDWLAEIGVEFTAESPFFEDDHEHYSSPRTYMGPDYGRSLLEPLKSELEKRINRGDIELHLNTEAMNLITDNAGSVAGVAIKDASGVQRELMAKTVILTTGGYGASDSLKSKYNPKSLKSKVICLPHASGDGIIMAERVGAELINMNHFVSFPGAIDGASGRLEYPPKHFPSGIWVNREGNRFVNEHTDNPDMRERAFLRQEELGFFVILNERSMKTKEIGIKGWDRNHLRQHTLSGLIKKADSIMSLAKKIGIPPTNLTKTVDQFNRSVKQGKDDQFNREQLDEPLENGPYYSIPITGSILITHGGIKVNHAMQVLQASGKVIDGLYAAGETLGLAQMMGTAVLSGMSVGPAITLGRQVARNACQYANLVGQSAVDCSIQKT